MNRKTVNALGRPAIGPASLCLFGLAFAGGCASFNADRSDERSSGWNEMRTHVQTRLAADALTDGNVDQAAKSIQEALRIDPENPRLLLMHGQVLIARGESRAAEQLLSSLVTPPGVHAEAQFLLGVIAQQRRDWEAALTHFTGAAELAPGEESYVVAATQVLLQLKEPKTALEWLESATDVLRSTPAFHAAAAECHEAVGDWEAAAASWEQALGPEEDPSIQERLAVALYRAGDSRQAISVLERALASEERPVLRLLLAECLLTVGRATEAGKVCETLVTTPELRPDAYALMASAEIARGDLTRAAGVADRALELDPGDAGLLEVRAVIALRSGDPQSAVRFARQAARVAGDASPTVQAVLAAAQTD